MSFKNRFTKLGIFFLICNFAIAFEAEDIISPKTGVWGNEQPLVLNAEDGSELYYSLSGTDPLLSGFYYDGPVVINKSGAVNLRITAVSPEGNRKDFCINYTVVSTDKTFYEADVFDFVSEIETMPIKKYVSGTDLVIPSLLKYSFNGKYFKDGKSLSLREDNGIERFTSCVVTDGKNSWHFVLNILSSPLQYPVNVLNAENLPFFINNWDTLIYTSSYYIYQIDNGDWMSSGNAITLDRSVSHTIRWQSVEYNADNVIEEFFLKEKPFISHKISNSTITYFIDQGEDYELSSFGVRGKQISVDAFDTEEISGKIRFIVYYNGLLQGAIDDSFSVDKIPPEPPVISSSNDLELSRDKVSLYISSEEECTILYSVSAPVESETGFQDITSSYFDNISGGMYQVYSNEEIALRSSGEKACFYKVKAYSVDNSGNKSDVTEYRVVVDEYNYYLYSGEVELNNPYFASKSNDTPNGSYTNPFRSFEQALQVINKSEFSKLHIMGQLVIDSGISEIKKDCLIIGSASRIVMPADSFIEINNCSVDFSGFIFEKQNGTESGNSSHTMFNLNKSDVSFTDCEIVGIFGHSGILYNASDSSLSFNECGITVQSDDYGCIVSSVNTQLLLDTCRITTVSPNCVNISVHGGVCRINNSDCSIIGKIGRSIELVNATAFLESNNFKTNNSDFSPYLSAIWTDDDSYIVRDVNNNIIGF